MSSPKLKLASRIATLEDMEANQHQQATQNQKFRQPTRVKSPDQVRPLRRRHWHVCQLLYTEDVYKDYPAWKKWAVDNVHIPLFNFFLKALKLFPPTGEDSDGRKIYIAHQGCFETQEEADVDAARYPHGYVVPDMPLGQSLTAEVENPNIYFAKNKEDTVRLGLVAAIVQEAKEIKTIVRRAHFIQ